MNERRNPFVIFVLCISFTALSAPADAAESEEFRNARRAVAAVVKIVQENADAELESVRPQLAPHLRVLEQATLTRREVVRLNEYVREQGRSIADTLKKWSGSAVVAMYSTEDFPGLLEDADEPNLGACFTYCVAFIEVECNTGQVIGVCLGVWDCGAGIGEHPCSDQEPAANLCENDPCITDCDCNDGWRCATWVFQRNECVRTCSSDSDCPSGQKCKKPLGTSFHRCK